MTEDEKIVMGVFHREEQQAHAYEDSRCEVRSKAVVGGILS